VQTLVHRCNASDIDRTRTVSCHAGLQMSLYLGADPAVWARQLWRQVPAIPAEEQRWRWARLIAAWFVATNVAAHPAARKLAALPQSTALRPVTAPDTRGTMYQAGAALLLWHRQRRTRRWQRVAAGQHACLLQQHESVVAAALAQHPVLLAEHADLSAALAAASRALPVGYSALAGRQLLCEHAPRAFPPSCREPDGSTAAPALALRLSTAAALAFAAAALPDAVGAVDWMIAIPWRQRREHTAAAAQALAALAPLPALQALALTDDSVCGRHGHWHAVHSASLQLSKLTCLTSLQLSLRMRSPRPARLQQCPRALQHDDHRALANAIGGMRQLQRLSLAMVRQHLGCGCLGVGAVQNAAADVA
jgi:hypothetical protein